MIRNTVDFFLGHPAHYHLFKNTAIDLKEKGWKVRFLIKRKDVLESLVVSSGVDYEIVRKKERQSSSKIGLALSLLSMDWNVAKCLIKNRTDLLIGTYTPLISRWTGVPTIVCNEDDAEVVPNFARLSYPFASDILVPTTCDCGKWNGKAIKIKTYQELAYLHPDNFSPDRAVAEKYVALDTPYFIVRFAKLNAHHDSGIKGINTDLAEKIIRMMTPFGRVYITSERPLEPQLEPYRIQINPIDMHHVMAFCSLYIGDSQTMAAEAGVLGVPFIRFNDFVGRIGYLRELEDVYHLGFGFKTNQEEQMLQSLQSLLEMKDRRDVFCSRKQKMLTEKIDYRRFLTWFISGYPQSRSEYKNAFCIDND